MFFQGVSCSALEVCLCKTYVMATATKTLVDMKLHGVTLDALVRRERRKGVGWQAIANDLAARTNVILSRETLRRWYPDLVVPENQPTMTRKSA